MFNACTCVRTFEQCRVSRSAARIGELVFYAIFQPYLVIYGGQFPQLEKQIVPASEPATFR